MSDNQLISTSSPAGSLSKLIHPGVFPESSKPGGTTAGTDDPARWQHFIWFDGQFWAAELKGDTQSVATFEGLKGHFDRYSGSGKSPWQRVFFPQKITGGSQ